MSFLVSTHPLLESVKTISRNSVFSGTCILSHLSAPSFELNIEPFDFSFTVKLNFKNFGVIKTTTYDGLVVEIAKSVVPQN